MGFKPRSTAWALFFWGSTLKLLDTKKPYWAWILFLPLSSGQIITTSAEVTLNGGLVRESTQNSLNSRLGIILICPDYHVFRGKWLLYIWKVTLLLEGLDFFSTSMIVRYCGEEKSDGNTSWYRSLIPFFTLGLTNIPSADRRISRASTLHDWNLTMWLRPPKPDKLIQNHHKIHHQLQSPIFLPCSYHHLPDPCSFFGRLLALPRSAKWCGHLWSIEVVDVINARGWFNYQGRIQQIRGLPW